MAFMPSGALIAREPSVRLEDVSKHFGDAVDSVNRRIEKRGLWQHNAGRLWKFRFSDVMSGRARVDTEWTK